MFVEKTQEVDPGHLTNVQEFLRKTKHLTVLFKVDSLAPSKASNSKPLISRRQLHVLMLNFHHRRRRRQRDFFKIKLTIMRSCIMDCINFPLHPAFPRKAHAR